MQAPVITNAVAAIQIFSKRFVQNKSNLNYALITINLFLFVLSLKILSYTIQSHDLQENIQANANVYAWKPQTLQIN